MPSDSFQRYQVSPKLQGFIYSFFQGNDHERKFTTSNYAIRLLNSSAIQITLFTPEFSQIIDSFQIRNGNNIASVRMVTIREVKKVITFYEDQLSYYGCYPTKLTTNLINKQAVLLHRLKLPFNHNKLAAISQVFFLYGLSLALLVDCSENYYLLICKDKEVDLCSLINRSQSQSNFMLKGILTFVGAQSKREVSDVQIFLFTNHVSDTSFKALIRKQWTLDIAFISFSFENQKRNPSLFTIETIISFNLRTVIPVDTSQYRIVKIHAQTENHQLLLLIHCEKGQLAIVYKVILDLTVLQQGLMGTQLFRCPKKEFALVLLQKQVYLTYRDNKGINIDIKNVNGGDSSKLNSDSIDKVKLIYGNKQVYLLTPIDVILLKNDIQGYDYRERQRQIYQKYQQTSKQARKVFVKYLEYQTFSNREQTKKTIAAKLVELKQMIKQLITQQNNDDSYFKEEVSNQLITFCIVHYVFEQDDHAVFEHLLRRQTILLEGDTTQLSRFLFKLIEEKYYNCFVTGIVAKAFPELCQCNIHIKKKIIQLLSGPITQCLKQLSLQQDKKLQYLEKQLIQLTIDEIQLDEDSLLSLIEQGQFQFLKRLIFRPQNPQDRLFLALFFSSEAISFKQLEEFVGMMSQKRDQIAVKQFAQEVFSRYFENVVAEKSTFGYSMGILTALESQSEVIYEYLLAKQPKLATLVALKLKKREQHSQNIKKVAMSLKNATNVHALLQSVNDCDNLLDKKQSIAAKICMSLGLPFHNSLQLVALIRAGKLSSKHLQRDLWVSFKRAMDLNEDQQKKLEKNINFAFPI